MEGASVRDPSINLGRQDSTLGRIVIQLLIPGNPQRPLLHPPTSEDLQERTTQQPNAHSLQKIQEHREREGAEEGGDENGARHQIGAGAELQGVKEGENGRRGAGLQDDDAPG